MKKKSLVILIIVLAVIIILSVFFFKGVLHKRTAYDPLLKIIPVIIKIFWLKRYQRHGCLKAIKPK
jgi:hypothetical protein